MFTTDVHNKDYVINIHEMLILTRTTKELEILKVWNSRNML